MVTPNINLIWISLHLLSILLIDKNKLLVHLFLKAYFIYSILIQLPKTFAQYTIVTYPLYHESLYLNYLRSIKINPWYSIRLR